MIQTERVIRYAVQEQVAICVVINKVDRLILELKLPPSDTYYKLRNIIEEINNILIACNSETQISPELGNVCFSSGMMGWSFTLQSFAKIYAENNGNLILFFSIDSYFNVIF